MSLVFLQQWLEATAFVTMSATLSILPGFLRRARAGGVMLLGLLSLVVALMCSWMHNPWLCSVLAFPVGVCLVRSEWKSWVRIFLASIVQTIGCSLFVFALLVMRSSSRPVFIEESLFWGVQVLSFVAAFPSLVDVLSVLGRRNAFAREQRLPSTEPVVWPGCCFQIATHNEPPALLKQVIERLMQQQYSGPWMIQIVDNNTSDPALWEPLQALCQELGERVQFLHLDPWPGFKAGALNAGMRQLPAWVSLIAVIDADYLVSEHFLAATVPHFSEHSVAFVQTPQSYRNGSSGLRLFFDMAFLFQMASRASWNAIWCSGTMLVLRRFSLEDVGGWDERCIMEDLELCLRLLGRGWRGIYDPSIYGTGLLPYDFASLTRQRFRWVFGTFQALKKHWRLLLGFPEPGHLHLTPMQRLSFIGLGCHYLSDGLSFLSALLLLVTAGWLVCHGSFPATVLPITLVVPAFVCLSLVLRVVWALHEVTGESYTSTFTALCFTCGLSWTTARACLTACIRQRGVFLRTPKKQDMRMRWNAFQSVIQESILTMSLLLMALATVLSSHGGSILTGLLLFQAGIYGIAPVLAFSNTWLRDTQRRFPLQKRSSPLVMQETRLHSLDEATRTGETIP